MLSLYLFVLASLFTLGHMVYKKEWHAPRTIEIFLGYILFFNMGIMGILAAYAHIFLGPETAKLIGWQPGNPFQFEIGIANLSYGVLGILSLWYRGRFWEAAIIGWSIFLLGCFVGHVIDYSVHNNDAPLNIGPFIWLNDLFLPLLVIILLSYLKADPSYDRKNH